MIDALERRGLEFEDFLQMPARFVDVRVAEHQKRARLRVRHKIQRRFEEGDACAFGADQCLRDVEFVLRQQRVEVVTRDSPAKLWESIANIVGVTVANCFQLRVDFAAPTARGDDRFQLFWGRFADAKSRPVVCQDFQLMCIVRHA